MKNINHLFQARSGEDYQRNNFDAFLKKIKFHFDVPSIHIAGTNGKGSVCYYLSSIYQEGGYKVGRFISPQLAEINECISINNQNISDKEIESIINDNLKLINKYELSSFEVLTFVALSYFNQQKCDIAIIECGMGGEVDATNVIEPVLSIITSVSLEHTAFLGKSVSEIAEQKAGIIKDDVPVLIGDLDEDALSVITSTCKEHKSPLSTVSMYANETLTNEGYKFDYISFGEINIKSHALYSVKDATFALDATDILKEKFPVSLENIKSGMNKTKIPCRFDIVSENPPIIIDGAHNPESMEKLTKSLQKAYENQKINVVLACFKDKNINSMLASIGQVANKIILTTFDHTRARKKEDYFLYADEYEFIDDPKEAINLAKEEDAIIVITGSLAFAGYIMDRFQRGEI